VRALAEGTVRRVLPIGLRAAGLDAEAERCAREGTADSARFAARAARAAVYAAYSAGYSCRAVDAAAASDAVLRESVAVALDAYAATSVVVAKAIDMLGTA
jgi:hypothetical protein